MGWREGGKGVGGVFLRERRKGGLEVALFKSIRLTAEVNRGRAASLSQSEGSCRPKMDASGSLADFFLVSQWHTYWPHSQHAQSLLMNISSVCVTLVHQDKVVGIPTVLFPSQAGWLGVTSGLLCASAGRRTDSGYLFDGHLAGIEKVIVPSVHNPPSPQVSGS